jgi:hypothetical protein
MCPYQINGIMNPVFFLIQLMLALRGRDRVDGRRRGRDLVQPACTPARNRRPATCSRRRLLRLGPDIGLAARPRRADGCERDVIHSIRAGSG